MAHRTETPVFQVDHVFKRPPSGNRDTYILSDLTFEVREGEIFSILGPSGAGKSALLRLLNGLDEPDRGAILFHGTALGEMDVFELRQTVGMVFQQPALLPGTVQDNLDYPRRISRRTGTLSLEDRELLQVVGLSPDLLERDSTALSVGQQQRIMIARALLTNPKVLLMDEPTSALDPSATRRILELAGDLRQEYGLTIVFVTHDIPEAEEIADRVLLLVEGRIKIIDSADTFFSGNTSRLARRFLSGELDTSGT